MCLSKHTYVGAWKHVFTPPLCSCTTHAPHTFSFLFHLSSDRHHPQPRDRFCFHFPKRNMAGYSRATAVRHSHLSSGRSDCRAPCSSRLTGAALGGSGATYQGLFRNPLADPFLIGVASGAGLGAVIAMSIQWPYSYWGLMAIPISAFIAALLTVFIVYSLRTLGNTIPTTKFNSRRRGFFLLRHFAHILPHVALHRRSPPRVGLAARRRKSKRLDRHPRHRALSTHRHWHFDLQWTRVESFTIRRRSSPTTRAQCHTHKKNFIDLPLHWRLPPL